MGEKKCIFFHPILLIGYLYYRTVTVPLNATNKHVIMNLYKIILLIVFFDFPILSYGQGYEVNVKIKNVPDNIKFYLIHSKNGKADTAETVRIYDGEFKFKGVVPVEGEVFFVKIDTSHYKIKKGNQSWFRVFLENKKIEATGEISDWPKVVIIGSETTNVLNVTAHRFKVINEIIRDSSPADSAKNKLELSKLKLFLDSITDANQDKIVVAALFHFYGVKFYSMEAQWEKFNSLSPQIRNSFYGKIWHEGMLTSKVRESIVEGGLLPNLSIKGPDGKTIVINEELKKHKFTLIDFWASWCVPCREEIPNLKDAFDMHQRNEFGIIGVSILDNDVRWRKALLRDSTNWVQGIDVDNKIADLFGVQSLPAYLLVDFEGRLLAYECSLSGVQPFGGSIRGEALKTKIRELLSVHK